MKTNEIKIKKSVVVQAGAKELKYPEDNIFKTNIKQLAERSKVTATPVNSSNI